MKMFVAVQVLRCLVSTSDPKVLECSKSFDLHIRKDSIKSMRKFDYKDTSSNSELSEGCRISGDFNFKYVSERCEDIAN